MRKIVTIFLSLFLFFPVFSEEFSAEIVSIIGKADYKRIAEDWHQAKIGIELHKGDCVATRFDSYLTLKINKSVVILNPVTIATIEQLAKTNKLEEVAMFLDVGSSRNNVHKSTDEIHYAIHTPIATACAKGTEFIIYANGTVYTVEGSVYKYVNSQNKAIINDSSEPNRFIPPKNHIIINKDHVSYTDNKHPERLRTPEKMKEPEKFKPYGDPQNIQKDGDFKEDHHFKMNNPDSPIKRPLDKENPDYPRFPSSNDHKDALPPDKRRNPNPPTK